MNFIDVSSWQRGLDLRELFENNPLDGAVVKATGGTSLVQSTCDPWVQWLIGNGKPWGFYHFLNDDGRGASGGEEAEFFVRHCENYFGEGMPFADYEGSASLRGTAYLGEFLERVYELTGIRCGIYCNLSTLRGQDFTRLAKDYPLWLAQYAGNEREDFGTEPRQKGSIEPFERYLMHQFSANGRLKGWEGALDLDRVTVTAEEWRRLAMGPAPERESAEPGRAIGLLEEALRLLKGGKR